MTGKPIQQKTASTETGSVDLPSAHLPPGLFLLSVADERGRFLWQTKVAKF